MPDQSFRMLGEWDLRPILNTNLVFKGGTYKIEQSGVTDLETVQALSESDGSSCRFSVLFREDPVQAARFRGFCAANAANADLRLFEKDAGWYYQVWGIQLEKERALDGPSGWMYDKYNVICILYSPYVYSVLAKSWKGSSLSLPQSKAITNEGHYDDPLGRLAITCKYDGGHVKALTLANTAGDSIIITDEALSDEVWLIENGKLIYETYEDTFASGTKHDHDTTGNGTFDTDHMELDNGESCVYHLTGPHYAHLPVILTLEATLDAGGATGEALIEVSSDGVTYYEAFDQASFDALGQVELSLQDTAYMQDIYVRFRCNSGTSGKKLNLHYVKFYVRRRIEDGEMPLIDAGKSSTLTLSCNEASGDLVDIDASFRARRLLI